MSDFYQTIHTQILANADPEIQKKLTRVIPGAKTVGVPVPILRELAKVFCGQNSLTLSQACDLMDELCHLGSREEILAGIFILGGFGKKATQISWARIQPWLDALDNWETCDQLASNIVGAVVAADLNLVDELLKLTASPNPWKRRFALATASELNHKGRVHPVETFRICELLVGDTEPAVRKALGWALKEASKHTPDQVFAFLLKHRGEIHSSALREAAEKLNPEQKTQLFVA
jgi:3-methyladenine DNA glycosylase AlkD